jgi:assimilatory nitrate reductase catalytic subunit
VFVPIHWSATNSSDARVGSLVNPVVDPISGEPEFKHTPVCVEPMRVDWYGVLYLLDGSASSRNDVAPPQVRDLTYWTRIRGDGFTRYELAGRDKLLDRSGASRAYREAWVRQLLNVPLAGGDYLDYEDTSSGIYRAAFIADNRLAGCLFISSRPQLPSREWLNGLATKNRLDDTDRRSLLAARPLGATADAGPLVCSCFRVGRKTLAEAIQCHGLKTPAEVGAHLKAGTHCGSCLPEIGALIASTPKAPVIV